MKKIVLAACLALSFAIPSVYAQSAAPVDPDSVAAVRELLDAMHYRDTARLMFAQMIKNLPAMTLQRVTADTNANKALTEDQKSQAIAKATRDGEKIAATLAAVFDDQTLMDDLIVELVPLYARNFTAAELHQMAAFYRSPIGVRVMEVMPQIASEMVLTAQKVMMPRMKAAMEQAVKPQ